MVSQLHDVPGPHVARAGIPAHLAATATEDVLAFVAPFACKIRTAQLIWDAAIVGADTNSTTVHLINAGTDGTGTTDLVNIPYVSGTNAAALATIAFYAPTTFLSLAAGVKLKVQLEKVGSGLLLPRGTLVITYEAA